MSQSWKIITVGCTVLFWLLRLVVSHYLKKQFVFRKYLFMVKWCKAGNGLHEKSLLPGVSLLLSFGVSQETTVGSHWQIFCMCQRAQRGSPLCLLPPLPITVQNELCLLLKFAFLSAVVPVSTQSDPSHRQWGYASPLLPNLLVHMCEDEFLKEDLLGQSVCAFVILRETAKPPS